MNYTEFVSSHHTNTDTSITVTNDYIILKNKYNIEVFRLIDISSKRLNILKSITNLDITDTAIKLDDLVIEYDNRGEPYTSGVSLTVNDTSIFLDKSDITEFIELVTSNVKDI